MTGFGEAHGRQDGLAVAVEVRTINSRYFKLTLRGSEGYGLLEPQVEAMVRKTIRRGTVQVLLRVDRAKSCEDFRINESVLEHYRVRLEALRQRWNLSQPVSLEALLALPGVVEEVPLGATDLSGEWPIIGRVLDEAMGRLAQMRAEEGRAMAADLRLNCRTIAAGLEHIEGRAPEVADAYRVRLEERLAKTLATYEITLEPADLLKEVGLFAERSDISEEIVRLRSHLEQFRRPCSCRKARGASWNSSPRKCSARPTPSAPRRTTWRSPAGSSKSRRRSSGFAK
jgi:uncharacterized protein (TIGR00255 family)